MTITSSTDAQVNAAVRNQSQAADAKPNQKNTAEAKSSEKPESPAVVVETANQQASASAATVSAAPIETADEALSIAQSISAALAGGSNSIANGSASAVSGLLSEFEAAVA